MKELNPEHRRMGWKMTVLICCLILFSGAGFTALIFSTEPTATRTGATRETAMLVEVTGVEQGTFHPTIVAMGTVVPAQDIILSPRVSGRIIERSPAFTPGGFIQEGETLLRIDAADYENVLQQRESDLRQTVADLDIELGRQSVARKDYQLLEENLAGHNKALVLREPQLHMARARVQAARAAVRQARLELQRTRIQAPFDAHVLSRNVDIGSQVSAGDNLGRLVGLDMYWVEATVPLSRLRWLSFPDNPGPKNLRPKNLRPKKLKPKKLKPKKLKQGAGPGPAEPQQTAGSEVRIRNRPAWPTEDYRVGRLYKMIGALDDQTRMARVLVAVEDPLAHRTESAGLPPLMIGTFVEAQIRAEAITDVIRINRDYVRKGDTVWVMQDGKLAIRKVAIVLLDERYAYIRSGLDKNDRVVTTNLTTVAAGVKLRLKASTTAGDANTGAAERPGTNSSGMDAAPEGAL